MINILLKALHIHWLNNSVLKMKVTLGEWKGRLWKCKLEWLYWLSWIQLVSSQRNMSWGAPPPDSAKSEVLQNAGIQHQCPHNRVWCLLFKVSSRKYQNAIISITWNLFVLFSKKKNLFRPDLVCHQYSSKWVTYTTVVWDNFRWYTQRTDEHFFYFNNCVFTLMLTSYW